MDRKGQILQASIDLIIELGLNSRNKEGTRLFEEGDARMIDPSDGLIPTH